MKLSCLWSICSARRAFCLYCVSAAVRCECTEQDLSGYPQGEITRMCKRVRAERAVP